MENIVIVVDAMGGDAGCATVVEGAVAALEDKRLAKIVLVGKKPEIEGVLSKMPHDAARIEIVHASETIETGESPVAAIKTKKDSSIVVGLKLVKQGEAAAFVSAGSTGAVLAGATTIIGRIDGIKRPALGVLIPNSTKGSTFLIDAGANVDAPPEYLLQFAQMGSIYMSNVMGVASPRVGLINVGAEVEKGNAQAKAAHNLLAQSNLNFTGNIEARQIPYGAVDVAVCDAFVGNVILKYTEGFAKSLFSALKEELFASPMSKFGALLSRKAFGRLRNRFDYKEVGGAPFIGLKGLVVKAHGSSDARSIKNSIFQCVKFVEADVVAKIANEVRRVE